jgi:hypothetical protein
MTRVRLPSLICLALAGSGCSGADAPDGSPPNASGGAATAEPPKNPLGRPRCQAPAGVSASPRDTQEALALLNALPKPTYVDCFVESLARPLGIQASNSIFSAQPALSAASPRVFIKAGEGWFSIVVDGDSRNLIEFGDVSPADPTRSIKGEIQLPVLAPVPADAPYDRVMFGDANTTCNFCHYEERHADNLPFRNAFESIAFRPRPDSLVSVDSLRAEYLRCDWQKEPDRCDMLWSIFGGGEVVELPFSASLPTFF